MLNHVYYYKCEYISKINQDSDPRLVLALVLARVLLCFDLLCVPSLLALSYTSSSIGNKRRTKDQSI